VTELTVREMVQLRQFIGPGNSLPTLLGATIIAMVD
jgi:hypothetical protein